MQQPDQTLSSSQIPISALHLTKSVIEVHEMFIIHVRTAAHTTTACNVLHVVVYSLLLHNLCNTADITVV